MRIYAKHGVNGRRLQGKNDENWLVSDHLSPRIPDIRARASGLRSPDRETFRQCSYENIASDGRIDNSAMLAEFATVPVSNILSFSRLFYLLWKPLCLRRYSRSCPR